MEYGSRTLDGRGMSTMIRFYLPYDLHPMAFLHMNLLVEEGRYDRRRIQLNFERLTLLCKNDQRK